MTKYVQNIIRKEIIPILYMVIHFILVKNDFKTESLAESGLNFISCFLRRQHKLLHKNVPTQQFIKCFTQPYIVKSIHSKSIFKNILHISRYVYIFEKLNKFKYILIFLFQNWL